MGAKCHRVLLHISGTGIIENLSEPALSLHKVHGQITFVPCVGNVQYMYIHVGIEINNISVEYIHKEGAHS